ncbi:MAG: type II toxin-antitoxin system prevent-host-death family antitoxin [Geopsychrobacter sp.]|nr:type II toxin-antitoxin system prevent-host-death family antitoxin [Geopsychrobacter sp.]
MQVNMHEAKSNLSALAEKARQGEIVVIAKAGKPFVDLLPHKDNHIPRKPGRFKGQIQIADDFDQTPLSVIDEFEGQS